jgi:hypothetical protein
MREIAYIFVLVSLSSATWQGVVSIAKRRVPTTIAFGTFSLFIYYGIGIFLELIGISYTVPYFRPFNLMDFNHWAPACLIIAISPWLLVIGGKLAGSGPFEKSLARTITSSLKPNRKITFYILSILTSIACACIGICYIIWHPSIWAARAAITEDFGALIIILYLPMHLLAFFIVQRDAQTRWGWVVSFFLVISSVAGTLAIGQRTNVLLPLLMIIMFRKRPTLFKPMICLILLFCSASILIPSFKSTDLYGSKNALELIANGIDSDIVRGPVLLDALAQSELVGTQILPFPMAGYWYSLQFFVPRSIAIAKGSSTASYYTGSVIGDDPKKLSWGFGIGFIEEIAINAGILAVIPGVLFYGFALGKLDRISRRWHGLVPATRFAALWMAGYHLPALLLTFGVMAGVAWACSFCFTTRNTPAPASQPKRQAMLSVPLVPQRGRYSGANLHRNLSYSNRC